MIRNAGDAVELDVVVVPRASKDSIVGPHDERLKIRIAAPPVDGAANTALTKLLARQLDVPRGAVTVVAGTTSKRKVVRIQGADARQVRTKLLP